MTQIEIAECIIKRGTCTGFDEFGCNDCQAYSKINNCTVSTDQVKWFKNWLNNEVKNAPKNAISKYLA